MRKVALLIILLLLTLFGYSQKGLAEPVEKPFNNSYFKLYQTQNNWIFIKLDTRNGKMWLVQFSLKDEDRFATILNANSLVEKANELQERFVLYPTQNMYNFILLDQINGNTWQVQWSIESKNRMIVPIEELK